MRIKNDQAGLTLVELLVTIVVASIVTLSACTMLLFGLRINNQSTKTSRGQNTVQVLMEALEDVAAEAQDLNVVSNPDSWEIRAGEKVLFSYVSKTQTIYTGKAIDNGVEIGTPFLKGIFASSVTYTGQLLTIDVQTEQDNYSTSIYCRMGTTEYEAVLSIGEKLVKYLNGDSQILPADISGIDYATNGKRNQFLITLASQIDSKGKIVGTDQNGKYYATWYQETGGIKSDGWGKDTPWCGCYVSWALWRNGKTGAENRPHWYANVDEFAKGQFLNYSALQSNGTSGDLMFFNLDEDKEADHIGVLLGKTTEKGIAYIYTIEGNSAGRAAVRKYAVGDPRIMGYGVLNWN